MSRSNALRALSGAVAACALLVACSGGGGDREVEIIAGADGCTPTSIGVERGEALTLVVKNEAGGDREVEGIDGTQLEELLVPDGRTRRLDYTMPGDSDLQKVKCYIPGGPSTVIALTTGAAVPVAAGTTAAPAATEGAAPAAADASTPTVTVDLDEWTVTPDVTEVAAGRVRFVAQNRSASMVHELAVVAIGADGQKREVAELEDVAPGTGGEFVADLARGTYELACLIAPGEAESTLDHYQQGMHTKFTVR